MGYPRIAGELLKLGMHVSPSTVRWLLLGADLQPAPNRVGPSWRDFLRQQAASMLACDCFTVETISLRRFYVLFSLSLVAAASSLRAAQPTRAELGDPASPQPQLHRSVRADAVPNPRPRRKFTAAFDEVFRSEEIRAIHTPIRAPRANAYAERFVCTVRAECLDWLLILGRRHLEVLRVYTAHYNREQRPHRGLALLTPEAGDAAGLPTTKRIDRRDRLGGLIHECHRAGA